MGSLREEGGVRNSMTRSRLNAGPGGARRLARGNAGLGRGAGQAVHHYQRRGVGVVYLDTTRPRVAVAASPALLSSMSDQTYDDGRARNLEAMLLALAERIRELQAGGKLLANASELTRLIGEVRSELFHYEVRATYDTPDVAESRRIVSEAKKKDEGKWEPTEWRADEDDETEW